MTTSTWSSATSASPRWTTNSTPSRSCAPTASPRSPTTCCSPTACAACGTRRSRLTRSRPTRSRPTRSRPTRSRPTRSRPTRSPPTRSRPTRSRPTRSRPDPLPTESPMLYAAIRQGACSSRRSVGQVGGRTAPDPAEPPNLPTAAGDQTEGPNIVIVDTGIADTSHPAARRGHALDRSAAGVRRVDSAERWARNDDDQIDPIAGHGTFIAGIIQHDRTALQADACSAQSPATATSAKHDLVRRSRQVAGLDPQPDIVNLSLGGYSVEDMPMLRNAVLQLQAHGDDHRRFGWQRCDLLPLLSGRVPRRHLGGSSGAGRTAHFTNYGSVGPRMCSRRRRRRARSSTTTIHRRLSTTGWACWSGTSFATPAVAGALAKALRDGLDKKDAVKRLIDDPGLFRIPGLGAVVNQTPWWRSLA